jgi:hypothetical protein
MLPFEIVDCALPLSVYVGSGTDHCTIKGYGAVQEDCTGVTLDGGSSGRKRQRTRPNQCRF